MEPALEVIRQHRTVAKIEIEKLKVEIDSRHAEMMTLQDMQTTAVKKLRDFEVELRAHERLLSHIERPFAFR